MGPAYRKWCITGFASLAMKEDRGQNEAGIALEDELKSNPTFWFGWHVLGNLRAILGKYTTSVSALQEAVRLYPSHFSSWYFLGLSLYRLGRFAEAIQAYEHARDLGSTDSSLWKLLAEAHWASNHPTDAIACCRTSLWLRPGNIYVRNFYYKVLFDHNFPPQS